MTPDAINRAIHCAIGRKIPQLATVRDGKPALADFMYAVPKYDRSLDAMHEAEKVLTPEQKISYALKLTSRCCGGDIIEATCASARQRAEAFLRTMSLWDDSK